MILVPQNRAQIYDFFLINELSVNISYFCRMKMSTKGVMTRSKYTFFTILISICFFSARAEAQVYLADSLVRSGGILHARYDFGKAREAFVQALEILEDTSLSATDSIRIMTVKDKLLLSENGMNMSAFSYSPEVIAKHKFSLDDFFLYYPLKDMSWRGLPNQLDSASTGGISRALYAPEDASRIYFSAEDADGIRNIYMTELQDTLWTVPTLLNEQITSPSDEIYPMLSPDGRSLYFSSAGLYGVGGLDIYVSEWSEETGDWSAPVNMGFPYSSPADDFLLINTEDDLYTIFASNRECASDSVYVYVLEYDSMPVRRPVTDAAELSELARLDPSEVVEDFETYEVETDIPENVDTRRYMDKMEEVRALRDSLTACTAFLDSMRGRFAMSNDDAERSELAGDILLVEGSIPMYQDSLDRAVAELQKIEMEFLFSGVVIDPDKMMAEADREVVGEATSYAFAKMSMGPALDLRMMQPEKKFDYSFRILDEGQFVEDNTIPEGIVYQIQIFTSLNKASVKSLKGLCPVFELRNASGRYLYRVGLFNSYSDVLSKLNAVKKAGFRSAFIVAYLDGKEVSVSKARAEEARKPVVQALYQVVIVPKGGEMDPLLSEGIRQQAGGKDMARSETSDGRVSYSVGPFTDKTKADAVMEFVRAMGIDEVVCEELSGK